MTENSGVLRYSAFAATPDGGNPAGVVLDGSDLSDEQMQRIAVDVGFSETAFLVARTDGDGVPRYRARYWSPAAEVPFCGHATVATAVALAERDGPGDVVFDTNAGAVTLRSTVDRDGAVTVSFTSVEPQVRDLDSDVLDRFLAPPSRWRIRARDWSFANPVMYRSMLWLTNAFATDDSVPDYRMD